VVAIAGVVIAVLLSGHGAPSSQQTIRLQRQEAYNDNLAAKWVVQQVSPTAIISSDKQMCAALVANGFSKRNVRVLGATSQTPLSSTLVIETASVRALFGTILATQNAPAVLTTIGSGTAQVDIRVMAPDGMAAAYNKALQSEQQTQRVAASALLTGGRVTTSAQAHRQMTQGLIDVRLVTLIAGITGSVPVDIVGFGNETPGLSSDVPLRYVDLAANDKASHLSSSAYVEAVTKYVDTQTSPTYRPTQPRVITLPGGTTILRLLFLAPSPLTLPPS
jgi:hypothetical protein